jgi:hypothetical protein
MSMPATAQPVRKVHLIFKTHLDVGFTDLARNVVAGYFDDYIPRAIQVAAELRAAGGPARLVWTTGSWLIYEYLEQAAPAARARLEEAIAAGDIAWHGLPCTFHSELLDPELFRFGLGLSQALDRRFGRRTIAAKMTDVPGHTRGIVSLLAEAGIEFLHIGVNAASTPPDVPPVFRWRAPDGAEITVMYHKGSYGDLMVVPGLDEAICFAHTGDNLGPQSAAEVRAAFDHVRQLLPGAEVCASTMDAFAEALRRVRSTLPVVTEEIGDTWIHGVGSDPGKVAHYRELLRLRRRWLEEGKVEPSDPRLAAFHRHLLLVPEHTWGLDVKTHLDDYTNYNGAQLDAAQAQANFAFMEESWAEQRAYITAAVDALGTSGLAEEARAHLAALRPQWPEPAGFTRIDGAGEALTAGNWQIGFDAQTGAIAHLKHRQRNRRWAMPAFPLGLIRYQAFDEGDYARFHRQYVNKDEAIAWWAIPDFTKPGIDAAGARSQVWTPRLDAVYHRRDAAGDAFQLWLSASEPAKAPFGCPASFVTEIYLHDAAPVINYTLQWFDKPACRLPEAIWLTFNPRVSRSSTWTMDKLGQAVAPLDVVRNGNRHLHAVGKGVHYRDGDAALAIETLDAPLVAPGKQSLLDFDNRRPPLRNGMHFLLYDNVWGTNFRMWYGEDARFRFVLGFEEKM